VIDQELHDLRAEVARRYKNWSIEQCSKEADANFVHLRTIRGARVLGILEFIENWPRDDQLNMMRANVDSGEPGAQLSERQQQLLHVVRHAASGGYGPRYMQMLEDYAAGRFQVPRGPIRRALKRDLTSVVGPPAQVEGAEWKHRSEVGKWTVVTVVDSGGATRQFEIGHVVQLAQSNLFSTSPTRWWGIGGPTNWNRVRIDDMDAATGAAAALCRYFIEQLPEMLHGL
jgi:hypothetical protein